MKKRILTTFLNVLLLSFLSLAHALDNCATTDAQVNLNVPCVEYQAQAYQATLTAISHNKGGFPLCWLLAPGTTTASDTSNCSTVDNDLNVQLSCVSFENNHYSVSLTSNTPQDSRPKVQFGSMTCQCRTHSA